MAEGRIHALLDRASSGRAASYVLVGGTAAVTAFDLQLVDTDGAEPTLPFRATPAVLLAAALVIAWLRARRGLPSALDRRFVLGCCGVVLALATIGPVLGSRDLWAYAMYGRIESVHHGDPYVDTPDQFPDDPYLERMNPIWVETPSVYGPAFNEYAAGLTRISGDSFDATRLLFKLTAAVSVLGALVVLHRRRVEPAVIAFVGLHPSTILYGVAGGHNDAIVGVALLAGTLLAIRRRPVWAAVAVALACLVKVATGLAVLPLAVWLWHRPDPRGRRDASILAGAFGGLVLGAYLLAGGRSALEPLSQASRKISWTSFWRPVDGWWDATPLGGVTTTIALAVVLVLVAGLLRQHRRDDGPEVLVTVVLLAYLVASAYSLVWYLFWLLPVAALRWRTPAMALAAVLATAYILPTSLRVGLQGTALAVAVVLAVGAVRRTRSTTEGQSTNSSTTATIHAQ
jgi:alpha-1,6-mannosyltransferase